jgi:hypothetical protein
MPRGGIDKDMRRAILDARSIILEAQKTDCNEAETRRRIERIFESVMGYDAFKHLSRERAVRGAGETEHVDFSIQLEEGENAKPGIMVEIKRVCIDLAPKHLKQVSSYAINAGCEWILLTNAREWRLYHVSFGQPPITKIIYSWNLLTDDVAVLAKNFEYISHKSLRKDLLNDLWQKTNVLHPRNMLQAILSPSSLKEIRRELRKNSGVLLSPEEILGGVRRLLNESALSELEAVQIAFPKPKRQRRRGKQQQEPSKKEGESISADPDGGEEGVSF